MARQSEQTDSLDLLLDTVCNAFGGIIFIVLLVAVLPSGSGSAESPVKAATPSQLTDLQRLQATLSHDERIVALQLETLDELKVVESAQDVKQVHELEEKMDKLRERVESNRKTTSELETEIQERKGEIQRLDGIAKRLEVGLLRGRSERDQGDVRATRLPRLRGVNKGNFFLVIYQGRVYLTHEPGLKSIKLYDNTADFEVERHSDARIYRPRPDRGMAVAEWVKSEQLKELQSQLTNELVVINICIYPDSIKDLPAVRNAFTEHGYDYNWHPLTQSRPLALVPYRGPTSAQ